MFVRYALGCLALLTFAFAVGRADAQSADNKEASASSGCTDIDFWAGDWEVRRQDGKIIATVTIKLSDGHCFATEYWNYTKLRGSGHSICVIAYSNQKHNWEYLCAGAFGDRYRFSNGQWLSNELRFEADDMPVGVTQKFSYVLLPGGSIRELELESSDEGRTWKTNVDVHWSRKR